MPITIVTVSNQNIVSLESDQPQDVIDALHIPVIAEIEPHPDPVYGHLFKWPAEVEQFIALNP